MQTKHVVFAALICILCAGAVIAAISGLSEPISAANTTQRMTLTPIVATAPDVGSPTITTPQDATNTTLDTSTISTTSVTTTNDTQTSSTTSGQ